MDRPARGAPAHGPAAFEHHAELPRVELDGGDATVLVGEHDGVRSPARHDTPIVGVDLDLRDRSTVPLRPDFEHALVVLRGSVAVDGEKVVPGHARLPRPGPRRARHRGRASTRASCCWAASRSPSPLLMWWNFVARSRDEIDAAYASWRDQDDRFGRVASRLPIIPAAAPFWH